jgi:hypothetical protein
LLKVKNHIYTLLFISSLSFCAFSQNYRPNEWKKYRSEVIFNVGVSQFLGDLGGRDQQGTQLSPADIEFSKTRPAITVGYRRKFAKAFNVSASFNFLHVAGDDKLTNELYRNNRNLNFKSNIYEVAVRAEASLYKGKVGNRYTLKSISGTRKPIKWEIIAFVGVGGFYFNPKGKNPVTGEWVKLHPLRTEGQGLPGGPEPYKKIALSIPFGFQWRVLINKEWSVGAEINYRKTFTDYIDDVSGVYYTDKALQLQTYGPNSLLMSDPSKNNIPGATSPDASGNGAIRGKNDKDTFLSFQVTVGYFIKIKKGGSKLRSKF